MSLIHFVQLPLLVVVHYGPPRVSRVTADARFNEEHKAWFYVNKNAPGGAQSQWTQ